MSDFGKSFIQLSEERDQLRKQLSNAQVECKRLENLCENAHRELVAHREKAQGNYWAWQGDGTDHLESLSFSCPVLISAVQLNEIVTSGATAQATIEKLRGALGDIEKASDWGYPKQTLPDGRVDQTDYQKGWNDVVLKIAEAFDRHEQALSDSKCDGALGELLKPTMGILTRLKALNGFISLHESFAKYWEPLCEEAERELTRLRSICGVNP